MPQTSEQRTVLVTGATGFTGGALAVHLAKQGHHVRALARQGSDTSHLHGLGIEIVTGDITSAADVDRAVAGVEQVYHVAACFRTANHPDSYYRQVNTEGARHVLDAARKYECERVIHTSTIGVHGHVNHEPADETEPFNPGDIYQQTKLEGEQLARQAQQDGQRVVIVRPASIYGPGDLRLLKLFRTIQQRRFRMFGPGTAHFHPVYIDDLVQGMAQCGHCEAAIGETFILCGPRYVTLNELVEHVSAAVNVRPPKGKLPLKPLLAASAVCEAVCVPLKIDPPLHRRRAHFFTHNRAFTCDKARRLIGYEPAIDVEQGMKQTAEWYFEAGHLPTPA